MAVRAPSGAVALEVRRQIMLSLARFGVILMGTVSIISGPSLFASRLEAAPAGVAHQPVQLTDNGANLVWAARAQTWIPTIYNPGYRQIPYPDGDIPWYFGVCTDVIVRAYRWLGVDLQVEVHKAGVGSGDTNIDHRRVSVLRKFFAQKGRSLPISSNPDDYMPGDIVTYYVPTAWFSKAHIAIVSDVEATGGVPLIIHNRGFGVQEENRLFAEKITGHYRYLP